MAYILKCSGLKRPYYLKRLRACGLPVDTYDRRKARIYKDRAKAAALAEALNNYTKSLAAGGGVVYDRDLYRIEFY